MIQRLLALAGFLLFALLSGCSEHRDAVVADAASSHILPVSQVSQEQWQACGEQQRHCAQLQLRPQSAETSAPRWLSLVRYPASDAEQRIGTLVFHAGGPGLSSTAVLDQLMRQQSDGLLSALRPHFDLLAYQPLQGPQLPGGCARLSDPLAGAPLIHSEDYSARAQAWQQSLASCPPNWADELAHYATQTQVQELEAIRQALGEDQLNFLHLSYGAHLAAHYAQAHPERVRSLLIDASMSPRHTLLQMALDITRALQANLEWMSQQCQDCGGDLPAQLLAAKQRLITAGEDLSLFASLSRRAAQMSLGLSEGLALLQALSQVESAAEVQALVSEGGEETIDPLTYRATLCQDYPERPSSDEVLAEANAFQQASALFGDQEIGLGLLCSGWPESSQPLERNTWMAMPALDQLLIGGTTDANTPLPWSMEMATTLGATHLFSQHAGHSVLLRSGATCAQGVAERFFVQRDKPSHNSLCLGG